MLDISIIDGAFTREFGFEEGCRRIYEAGFRVVDWTLPRAWRITITSKTGRIPEDSYMLQDFEYIKEYLRPQVEDIKNAGLTIGQSHAEIGVFFANKPEFTADCVKGYSNTIKACEWVGCPYLIIHPLSRPLDDELTYEEIFDRNITLFSGLIPQLKESGVKVCIENTVVHTHDQQDRCSMFFDDPYDAVRMLDTLNEMAGQECFAFCLDTGHLNLSRKTQREYINVLGHRLQTLHLNDNHLSGDSHNSPRHGTADWDEIIAGLRDIHYRGTLNFETCVMPYYEGLAEYGMEMRERILAPEA